MITGTLLSPTCMVLWDPWEVPTEVRGADVVGIRAELKELFCPPCPESLNPQAPWTLGQGLLTWQGQRTKLPLRLRQAPAAQRIYSLTIDRPGGSSEGYDDACPGQRNGRAQG